MPKGWGKLALVAAVAALFAGRWCAEFTADRLWADSLGAAAAYTDIALLRLALGAGAFAIATAWYVGNLLLLYRQIGAVQVPRQVGDLEIVEHVPRRYLVAGVVVVGVVLGILSSLGADDAWMVRVLAGAGVPTGAIDPVLRRDYAYFLFDLPWQRALQGYALWLSGIGLGLLTMLYVAIGAVRREERRLIFLPFARWHLAALSGTLALVLAWGYTLEPGELAAGLHDVPFDTVLLDIRIPGAVVLAALALGTAAASVVWMRIDRTRIPATAWGTLLVASFLAHFVVPAMVAGGRGAAGRAAPDLQVAAAAAVQEALGGAADTIAVPLAVPDLQFPARHEADLAGTPVWDPGVLAELLNRVARPSPPDPRAQGRFFTVDLGVTGVGAAATPVFLAAREPDLGVNGGQAAHAVGMVAVHAARVAPGGLPLFVPDLTRPDSVVGRLADVTLAGRRTWFSPAAAGDAVVGPDAGAVGVPVGGLGRRVALAWALQRPSLLAGNGPSAGALVVTERAVAARLARYAPFARFGAAWSAVSEGRLMWVAWGYVAGSAYPLGTRISWRGEDVRYLWAGFVGVVDAETGHVRVYLSADADPVSAAWQRVLPELVQPAATLPDALRRQLRYPEEVFRARLHALREARARVADPYWWAGPSVGDSITRLRLRAVDEVYLEPRVAAVLEGVVDGGIPRLRVLRYPEPFTLGGPSALDSAFAAVAPSGAAVPGQLRLIPFADGALGLQAFYADSGTLSGVVTGWRGAVGSAPTLREALRQIGPTATTGPPPAGTPFDLAREWFLRLDRARAAADWEAFGEAWAGLRAAFALPADPARIRVDSPVPRD